MKLFALLIGLIVYQNVSSQDHQIIGNKYTFLAMDKKSEGKIFVSFVISSTGEIYDDSVKAINSLDGLEIIAVETIREAPNWSPQIKPGRPDGTTKFVVPIVFTLEQLTKKDWSDYHIIKSKILVNDDYLNDAILELKKSIKLYKKNGEAYFLLGQLLIKQDKLEDAKNNFELAKKYGFVEI